MREPRLSTLDILMAENRRLKAENAMLVKGIEAMAAKTELVLGVAREIHAARTFADVRPPFDPTIRIRDIE